MHPARRSWVILYRQPIFLLAQGVLIAPLGIFNGLMIMTPAIMIPSLKMAGLTTLLCCFAIAQQSAGTAVPSLTSIVRGMEKSQSEVRRQTPYQVIREYSLFGMKSSSANAEVVAQVDFNPPTGKDYSIQTWSGSARGKQVVQRGVERAIRDQFVRPEAARAEAADRQQRP